MEQFLTIVFIGFIVGVTSLVGLTVHDLVSRTRWMKAGVLLGFTGGTITFIGLIEHGWPLYQTIIMSTFIK
jgi:hypothetical protein